MRETVKRFLPSFVRQHVAALSKDLRLRRFAAQMSRMHARRLAGLRGQAPIRTVFLVSNLASWKVDPLFERMRDDPAFEPVVAICPLVHGHGRSFAIEERDRLARHFEERGHRFIDLTSMGGSEGRAAIEKLEPAVLLFTNPHRLTFQELHDEIFENHLSCYVPYSHEVVAYGDNREQFNQLSHNAFWKVFVPHDVSARYYGRYRAKGGQGVVVTGFPCCEPLLSKSRERMPDPWKAGPRRRKRIVWAPHWVLRPDLKMATIHELGEAMRRIAAEYRDEVQWAMKPHPFLRSALNEHEDWGPDRTAAFFDFWADSPFSQIEEDDYMPLFVHSDALIHDSGSFLAEYLYLDKPMMYLRTGTTSAGYLNAFGARALAAGEVGGGEAEIRAFVEDVIAGRDAGGARRRAFREREVLPLFETPPSEKICEEIRQALR